MIESYNTFGEDEALDEAQADEGMEGEEEECKEDDAEVEVFLACLCNNFCGQNILL